MVDVSSGIGVREEKRELVRGEGRGGWEEVVDEGRGRVGGEGELVSKLEIAIGG